MFFSNKINILRERITFKVHVGTILSSPRVTLSHNNCWQYLLPKIGLPLFHSSHDQVTNTSIWQSVEATLDSFHRYDVKILGPSVVAQFTTAATGKPSDILNLLPAEPPRPETQTQRKLLTFFYNH